jgi:chromosome segregation ATPase
MFPLIEEKGGELSPTTSDFSQIVELQQFKRLYEEQEEKIKLKLAEKEEQMNELRQAIHQRDDQIEELKVRQQELGTERERLKGDYARLRQEAQEKIDKLMERIKDLNQRLMGGGEAGATPPKSGIFR